MGLKANVVACLAVVLVFGVAGARAHGQSGNKPEIPAQNALASDPWEMGALVQGGFGVTEERSSFKFFMAGAHLGKVLTNPHLPWLLRGQFEYAVEVFPFWQSYTPTFQRAHCVAAQAPFISCTPLYTSGGTYTGVSIIPMMLRWNFVSGHRLVPWVQGAGGVIWTNHKYPGFGEGQISLANDGPATDSSVFNFTPQFGIGTHYFISPRRSIDFSANAVHVSSASLGDRNPGVNASVQFSLGYTWWK